MAVIHVVLVKFKADVTETVKKELCDKVCALKETIPGITKATAGKNFSERAKGFEWGWVFEHVSKKDLDAYAIHPDHLQYVKDLAPYKEDILSFDYEV
ncbi:hypothetical protein Unana1_03103 [Umbelopsis nana]